jgi:hypothetical protein
MITVTSRKGRCMLYLKDRSLCSEDSRNGRRREQFKKRNDKVHVVVEGREHLPRPCRP